MTDDRWEYRASLDRQADFSKRAQPSPRLKLVTLQQRRSEEVPPFWTRVRTKLPTFLVSLTVIGGTVVFGVAPLVAGSVLLGKPVGVPIGAGVAAIAMVVVFWAAMRTRYRDAPGGWVAGLLAFVIGILMLLLAPILGARMLLPSPVGSAVGTAIGVGLVAGLGLLAKRRGLLWPKTMGWPGPPPGHAGLGG